MQATVEHFEMLSDDLQMSSDSFVEFTLFCVESSEYVVETLYPYSKPSLIDFRFALVRL